MYRMFELVTWLPGKKSWLPGYLVTWLPGYLVTWLPGCTGLWSNRVCVNLNGRVMV